MSGSGVKFLYVPVSDLDAMRHFYTELVGLDEIYFAADEALAYDCDGLQFTMLFDPNPPAVPEGWATQPGWRGATVAAMSWSIELTEAGFRGAVSRSAEAGVIALHDVPQWVGYWSYPVKDPMGYTAEITWPDEDVHATNWVD